MRLHIIVARGSKEEHWYDIGTREVYGLPRGTGERPRFLEDFLQDYEVVRILEIGPQYYRAVRT
jgi:hypothetical protein